LGNPNHYSLDLPDRCLQLIDGLWKHVAQLPERGQPDLGPLTTTFLLAMAMPMIILPIERIERHLGRKIDEGYADDRRNSPPRLLKAIEGGLGGQKLRHSPFYSADAWSFIDLPRSDVNIAQGLPYEVAEALASPVARERAASMPASQWCGVLRNALAHGGIAYLDNTGQSTPTLRAESLCFVSGKFANDGSLVGIRLLRISEAHFFRFLHAWTEWLQKSGVEKLMAA
jgi:hypothetical protein